MVRVCKTGEDVSAACGVLRGVYEAAGYLRPGDALPALQVASGLHSCVMLDDLSPCRLHGDNAINRGTVTAILDRRAGLPIQSTYPVEVAGLRTAGMKLCEIGLLAVRGGGGGEFAVVLELFRYAFWFAVHHGASHIVCGIPPRRVRLDGIAMGFEPMGEPREVLAGAPVQFTVASVEKSMARRPRVIDYFLRHPLGAGEFVERWC